MADSLKFVYVCMMYKNQTPTKMLAIYKGESLDGTTQSVTKKFSAFQSIHGPKRTYAKKKMKDYLVKP